MNPPNRTNEEIFFAASELSDAAVRAAFLDLACGARIELRRRLEGLLAVEPKVEQFLESPAVAPINGADTALGDENIGTVIGRYKLIEVIGEGGMGVVYLAEQTKPRRSEPGRRGQDADDSPLGPVTGQELLTLDGHKGQVNRLAFSPDGTVLASCSHDGAVKLWRAPRRRGSF